MSHAGHVAAPPPAGMRRYGRGVVLAVAAVAAAGGCGTPEATAVQLAVSYDPEWALDELEVQVADRAERTGARARLRVLLPDALAGDAVVIDLGGLRGGARLAHGVVEVVPELHGEVEAHVALAPLPCGAWCSPGERECRGDAVVVCEPRDGGCPAWGAPAPCGGDTPYCSAGACAADCVDECTTGETRCDGPEQVRSCGQADADDCLEWLAPEACPDGHTCVGGSCSSACADACADGAVMCAGDGTRACGDADDDGCTEWGPTQACPAGHDCLDGACVAVCDPSSCAVRDCGVVDGCDCGGCAEATWCGAHCAGAACEDNYCCLPYGSSCHPHDDFLYRACCPGTYCIGGICTP